MAAVGRLTAGVAHDFNNLLAAIIGNAEILHSQLGDHSAHGRRVAMILQTAGRGADLVRQLLAFSRKQELAPVLVDLNQVVRGMGDLLRATLGRAIRVETRLDERLWPALIDPVQIEHVILNLAINARDAMPDGGTLTIATANTTLGRDGATIDLPAGDYVVVAVIDTGTGMDEAVLHNAFEPFFTTKPPGLGSGLGLSQVYGVASQSGGGVRIESAVGKGTTVSVLFPRAARQTDVDGGAGPERVIGAEPRRGAVALNRTILVVDDEAECRDTISAMLAANGFSVALAESGEAALRLVDQGLEFHLLLVDFAMPGMNGAELAQEVRARRPSIPVVFFTGGDGEWISGERWVLTKPFPSHTLTDTLRAALGLAQRDQLDPSRHIADGVSGPLRRRPPDPASVRADRRQHRGVRHHASAAGRCRAVAAGRPRNQRAIAAAARAAWAGSAGMGAVWPLHARGAARRPRRLDSEQPAGAGRRADRVSGDAAACAGVAAAGEPVRCAGGRAGGDAAGVALRRGGDDADPVRRVDADLLAGPDAAGAVRRRPGLAAGWRTDAGRARSASDHRHERDRQPAVGQRNDDRRQPAAYAAAGGDAGERAAGVDRAHHARRGAVGGNGGSCAHRAGEGSDGCGRDPAPHPAQRRDPDRDRDRPAAWSAAVRCGADRDHLFAAGSGTADGRTRSCRATIRWCRRARCSSPCCSCW